MVPVRQLIALSLLGCGDNALPDGLPLAPARDVAIVAHQDDDLLFMQPDLVEAVRAGTGVTSVYVTAGNGTHGLDEANRRYAGLRAAYAEAASDDHWQCGWITLTGHTAEHCRLDAANVSLVFLGYPDGGKEGEQTDSLLHLWQGAIAGADTIAARTAHYDRDGLIDTVAGVIRVAQPATIHTLEIAATHGRDHSDHMLVGALALVAVARSDSLAELRSYRGYDVEDDPPNKSDALYADELSVLARYEGCYAGCAPCGEACSESSIDPSHVAWLHRRYAVGFLRRAAGVLHSGASCLGAGGQIADCATAPAWRIDAAGELRDGDACLTVADDGSLSTTTCAGGPSRRFFVDDEGHIWSALPAAPDQVADYDHATCLSPSATVVACGADFAPAWDFVPEVVATPRATLGLTATGRALRIADLTGDGKGDLCAVEAGGLMCAPGDGAGGFGPAVRIDLPGAPLAIDPQSLTLGDVDNDGHPDACGLLLDGSGIACATAAQKFAAQAWTSEFGADGVTGTAQSLAIVNGAVCGLSARGVTCAKPASAPVVLFTDPNLDLGIVMPGQLDFDTQPDWCFLDNTSMPDSPSAISAACAVAAEANDPWLWSFASGDRFPYPELEPPDKVALVDIDGDGRADLCSLSAAGVACARSQGRGFGPLSVLASPLIGDSLALGDLDGDGLPDACVATAAAVTCAVNR
jgi:LmbE family N-acetylglucosaminyl deacetylase